MDDNELVAALADLLDEPVGEPDSARVDAVRAAARARQADTTRFGSGPHTTPDPENTHQPRRWPRVLSAAAAVIIVVSAASAIATLAIRDDDTGDVEYAGPITGARADGDLVVTKTGIGRVIELDSDDLPILPSGEFYEVWFVGPGDTPANPNRISAGTFHPDDDGRSRVFFSAAVDPTLYPTIEITAEPGDGDPNATTDVVLQTQID